MRRDELSAPERAKFEAVELEEKQAIQNGWAAVLTEEMFVKIKAHGNSKEPLQVPWTLVAVVKQSGDVFVSQYYPLSENPIQTMIQGTMKQPIKPPIRIFLFDKVNPHTTRGDIDAAGTWVPY